MLALGGSSGCTSRVCFPNIDDLESDIVGYGANKRRMEGVVLDVVDDRAVVCVRARRLEGLVTLRVCRQVPV